MNIEQVLVELPKPILQLVSLIKPDSASEQHWLEYAEVRNVKLSVEHHELGGYSVIITCEPVLALKVNVSAGLVMDDQITYYGDPNDILHMVTGAVSAMEHSREQKIR